MLGIAQILLGILKDMKEWKKLNKMAVVIIILGLLGWGFYDKLTGRVQAIEKKQRRQGEIIREIPKMQRSLTRIERALKIPPEENYYGPRGRGEENFNEEE